MRRATLLLAIIFILNAPSIYYGWYLNYWWLDVVLHFFGGFFVAMFMAYYLKNHLLSREKIKNALIVIGAATFIGVVWEFAEYLANQTLINVIYEKFKIRTYFMGDLRDTIIDLLLDILGAFLFFGLHLFRTRKSHQVQT